MNGLPSQGTIPAEGDSDESMVSGGRPAGTVAEHCREPGRSGDVRPGRRDLARQHPAVAGVALFDCLRLVRPTDARTDGFTSLAVVAAALGVMAGFPLADPIVGLLITVAILFILRGAATDIYRRLMDGVDPELVDTAEAALRAVPGVLSVDELRLR